MQIVISFNNFKSLFINLINPKLSKPNFLEQKKYKLKKNFFKVDVNLIFVISNTFSFDVCF